MTSSTGFIASVESNKREMFDAMRAYQESEQAHKQDAISLLTTILTATGAVFAALIVPEKPIVHSELLAAFVALVAIVLSVVVVHTTNKKIAADHLVYASFGDEYVRCCEVLGLFDPVQLGPTKQPLKIRVLIGHGPGWKITQNIVRSVGATVMLFSLCAFFYVFFSAGASRKPCAIGNSASSQQVESAVKTASATGAAK